MSASKSDLVTVSSLPTENLSGPHPPSCRWRAAFFGELCHAPTKRRCCLETEIRMFCLSYVVSRYARERKGGCHVNSCQESCSFNACSRDVCHPGWLRQGCCNAGNQDSQGWSAGRSWGSGGQVLQ